MYGFPSAKRKNTGGGPIVGPGTGTSDSIQKQAPVGSFIMPADSTAAIGHDGLAQLGLSKKSATINVSNGEYELPPEQVHAIGIQALRSMKDATHTPVAEPDRGPQQFFANGGAISNPLEGVGEYWSKDNAEFESGNPGLMARTGRALNPLTGFGSAVGAMHDAAGQGSIRDMGIAAVQSIPVFGAVRAVAPTLKTAAGLAPSLGKTAIVGSGNVAAGVGADEVQAQSFSQGGPVLDPEELKKKQTSFDATNTQVGTGYSGFRPAAALQQASDARHQQTAVRADAAQSTVSRATNGAIDTAMQVGAVQNSLPPKVPAAPPSAVARRPEGFAPGLKIMQPARDAQMVRRIRAEEQATPANPAPAISQAPAVIAAPAERGVIDEFSDGLGGAAKTAVGVLAYPQLAAYDGLRNAAGTLAGGDTSQIKQYRDEASGFAAEGMTQMQDSARALREGAASGTREALGINKAAQPIAAGSKPAAANVAPAALNEAAQVQESPDQAAQAGNGYMQTGIGQGAAGGPIVGRVGANGVPEFTNDAQAVAGAQPMPAAGFIAPSTRGRAPGAMTAPAGARVLASGTNVPGADAELAATGSSANIGNGVGTFSQAEAGDAALAAGRFERANEERAKMVAASRAGEPNGGLTIVGDSSRKPSLQERQLARLNERNANIEAMQARTELGFAALNQRSATEQIEQQKLLQDMQAGQLTLEQQQRVAQIQQQLSDPSLAPEQRAQLESAYYSLAGNTNDRYMEVRGGTNADGGKDASKVFDSRTGKYVNDPQGAVTIDVDERAIAIRNNPQLSREQKVAQLKALGYN